MFGLSPYLLIGALLSGIALGVGGYFKGDADAANRYKLTISQMQAAAEAQVQKVRDANIAQANAAVASLESQDAKSRIVYRTIHDTVDRIVEKPVYKNSCLDADGLTLANAALGGTSVAMPLPASSTE